MGTTAASIGRQRARARLRSEQLLPYVFLAPTIIMLLAVTVYPILFGLVISLFDWELTAAAPRFIGLDNFVRALTAEPALLHAIRVTLIFVVFSVVFSFLCGLGLAVLMNQRFVGNRQARAVMLLPIMMSPVVVGFIFQMMFHAHYGIVNFLFKDVFHIINENVVWLGEPWLALFTTIATDVWLGMPFVALILLAGLQSLDREPYEAAAVDGASRWQGFRHITWPLLRNSIMVAVTIRTILAARVFDMIYTLTSGGPGGFTEVLAFKAYRYGLEYFQVGYGSALTVLLVIMTVVLLGIVIKLVEWATAA